MEIQPTRTILVGLRKTVVLLLAEAVAAVAYGMTIGRSNSAWPIVKIWKRVLIIISNMKFLKEMFVLLMLCACGTALASITTGYYHIKSYNNKYLTENTAGHTLVCSDLTSSANYAQVWKVNVSGSSVTLQNALTDRYIQKTTGNSWSEQYVTGTSSNTFTLNDEGSGIYTFEDKWSGGLHCDASLNVVLWLTNEAKSKWTVEAVTVDESALAAQKAALTEVSTDKLLNYFTTTACTQLKSAQSSYSDELLINTMSNDVPQTVIDMALKVKNNTWATYDGWDKTERTFRIADYKPYSSHTRWTSILSKGHSMGRLSNPTGIWVNSGEVIQVYVGTIPNGQSVALEVAGYGQSSGTQYTLHSGMNSLLMASSGNCFVFYEVDNTTSGNAPYKSLSNYADVTVHIEGGTVQGYFDLTKGYTDDDWTKMKSLLLTDTSNRPSVCLKTDKHVMNLGITRLISALNGSSITEMLNVWKNLSEWEDELCGRSDSYGGQTTYGQFCNNVYSVTALPGTDGSPHATNYGTYFYEYSDPLIFNAEKLMTVADNMWCIAHEQGHNRQTPINMVGNTEMSNNVFSNMAIYKQGRYTSRTASIKDVFSDYIDGISWPERVQRACGGVGNYNAHLLHLNWSLYLFFHVNGNDPDFFPRLFDALRAEPMTKVSGSSTLTPASTDYLKYYVKCCEVSGYDLTDFFASYGFFMLPPEQATSITYNGVTTNRYQSFNDYADYNLYVTQEMIDAAKAQVAAMSGLKTTNIVFIEDRVAAPLATYEGHADGELRAVNPDAPVKAFGQVGETGQYTDYDATCSAYAFNVDNKGHVTVSGTGAVGFIVYDATGNIAGFYNTTSFKLPDDIGTNYTIKAAAGDGSQIVATKDTSIEVIVNDFPRTDMWYSFRSLRGSRYMLSNGAGQGVVGTTETTLTDSRQWKFVAREGESEAFDIVNRNDGSYLDPTASWDSQVTTTAAQPSTGWRVEPAATDGLYIITTGSVQLNQTSYEGTNGNMIYNWGGGSNTTDEGCQFTIEEVELFDSPELSDTALEELEGYYIKVASEAAASLTAGQWYVMYDRGITDGLYPHGYLYEQVSSHTLYNTLTAPSGKAVDACRHLVRLVDAGEGKYYLQTGYGNYFGKIGQSTAVPVLSTMMQRITVAKIANTDGHFYLQGETGGVILDANECVTSGDATVVGYGTTVPTTLNGNNDWAFYPVALIGLGDVNADGSVTIADVTALVNIILGKATDETGVADVNGDGSVTIADVTALVNIILGK